MIELIVAVVVAACATLIGARRLGKLGVQATGIRAIAYSLGIGIAFYSLCSFAALAIGVANAYAFALLLAVSIAFGFASCGKIVAAFNDARKEFEKPTFFEKAIIVLIAALVVMHFVASLAPPTTAASGPMDFDSLNYHLLIPKVYLQAGSFVRMDWLPHANWPNAMEATYLLPMSLTNEVSARILSLLLNAALLLFSYSFARRFVKREYALAATAIFFSMPTANFSFGTAYVDLHLAFFFLLSLDALLEWRDKKQFGFLVLAGVFGGMALATKLIGVVAAAIALAVMVLFLLEKKELKQSRFFLLPAAIVAAPWFIKTFVWYGNPVWPLYYDFFQFFGFSGAGAQYFNQVWSAASASSGFGRSVAGALLLPWNLLAHARAFNGLLTPLLALVATVLFVKRSKEINLLCAAAIILVTAWFLTYQEARFLFPAVALLAVICAYGAQEFFKTTLSKRIVFAVIAVVLLANVGITLAYKHDAFPVAVGLEAREDYLLRTHENYAACKWANENLPTDAKIIFFTAETGYYCDRSVVYSTFLDYGKPTNEQELRSSLKELKATHVLVNLRQQEKILATNANAPLFKRLEGNSEKVFQAGDVAVFELS